MVASGKGKKGVGGASTAFLISKHWRGGKRKEGTDYLLNELPLGMGLWGGE